MFRFCVKNLKTTIPKDSFNSRNISKSKLIRSSNNRAQESRHNLTLSHEIKRNIQIFSHLNVRTFKDSENDYAFGILQSSPLKNNELFRTQSPNAVISTLIEFNGLLLNTNWREKSGSEIIEAFKSVVDFCVKNHINLSDGRFNNLVDGLMDNVEKLTDQELSDLFHCLIKLPMCDSYTAHNYHDIWSALDDICCWKLPSWSLETRFLFAQHWYRLHLASLSDFMFEFIDKMGKQLKFLSKNELVHFFFYIRTNRRTALLFEHQFTLDKHIGDLTVEETIIVARAFLRLKTKIKMKSTVECIAQKLKHELPNINDSCFRAIIEVRKVGKYTNALIKKLGENSSKLNKAQLIHAFFYINVRRTSSVDFNLEDVLEKYIRTMNVDEMSIVAMGFFKSQTIIRHKLLLTPIIEQLKKECKNVHEITLTTILKLLRYSSHALLIDQLMDLLDHVVPEIDRFSELSCIHVALLGTTLQFLHEKSLQRVSEKILNSITNPQLVRLKDLERLLLPLTMFDYDPKTNPDIFHAICSELHTEARRREVLNYTKCLPCALNLLSIKNIYSYELMNDVLDMDRIIELYGKNARGCPRDILQLDVGIDVECPDYEGNRLEKNFRHALTKWNVDYTPQEDQYRKITSTDRFFLDVVQTIAKLVGGSRNFHINHVLPNYVKSDIILCQDESGLFVEPKNFEIYTLGDVMRPLNSSLRWFAVIPVSWNNTIKNSTKPLGLVNRKYRQLKAIGYKPILIIWNEFLPLTEKGRVEYVINKIKQA